MFKKLAALVCAGMLFLAGMTGIGFAKSEDVPLVQKIAYAYNEEKLNSIVEWTMEEGYPNVWAFILGARWMSDQRLDNGQILTTNFSLVTREGYQLLCTPRDDGRMLTLLEIFGDGDVLVDAVGIYNPADGSVCVLRFMGDEIPSIYSAVFQKAMSKIAIEYAYNCDIPADTNIKCLGELDGSEA